MFSMRNMKSYLNHQILPIIWQKYEHLVLVNHLGGLSLPRNTVVRLTLLHSERPKLHTVFLSAIGLTDCLNMTIAVFCGLKATKHILLIKNSTELLINP